MPLMTTEERLGKTIDGKYRLDSVLGEGGMGVVYKGMHVRLGRAVAVKFLHPQFSQNAEVVQRFVREAQSAARLQHPNVVDVRDIDTAEDGSLFMVLELLAGESVASRLSQSGPLSLAETLTMILPAMDAVAVAHEHGIVHRDIKPDNLFLSRTPAGAMVPKVLDFGIAKLAQTAGAGSTGTGSVIGTPAYMAPEQAMGKKDVGPAADVWSMGNVLYECLTGRLPFDFPEDAPPTAVIVTVVTSEPYPISRFRHDLPPQVAAVIDAALIKDAGRRYRNMRDFHDALRAAAAGVSVSMADGQAALRRDATSPTVAASITGPGAWSGAPGGGTGGAGAHPSQAGHPSQPGYAHPGHPSQPGYAHPGHPSQPGYAHPGHPSQPGYAHPGHPSQSGVSATPSMHGPSMHGPTPFVSGGTVAQLESNIAGRRSPLGLIAGVAVVGILGIIGGAVAFSGGASDGSPEVAAAAAPADGVPVLGTPPTEASAPPTATDVAGSPAGPAGDPGAAPAVGSPAVVPASAAHVEPSGTSAGARHGHGSTSGRTTTTLAAGASTGAATEAPPPPTTGVTIRPVTPPSDVPATPASPEREAADDATERAGTTRRSSSSGGSTTTTSEPPSSGGTREGSTPSHRSGSMSADEF